MTDYQKKQEAVRKEAINWQLNIAENLSMDELWEAQQYFIAQGKKYGLIEEFRENGII